MKTKKLSLLLALCCIISIVLAIPAFAAEDSFPYSFKMKASQSSNYSDTAYTRTAVDTENPWKVDFRYNGEGDNTIAIYWLAADKLIGHSQVSSSYNVVAGSGAKYYRAYETATGEDCVLGAKNNNNVTSSYTISGYWDEEIGEHVDGLPD